MIDRHHSCGGFTFVEFLVAMAINALLFIAFMLAVSSFYQINSYSLDQAGEVDNARRGITKMVRDLREMTFADDGTWPIVIMEENLLGFYSDIDQDNSVEYVEFEVATTTLYKRVYNPTGSPPVYDTSSHDEEIILSEYVRNLEQATSTFYYYDTNNVISTSTTLLTDVRYIKMHIIVNVDPNRSPGEFMLRSSAAPRNLKDNL